MKTITNWFRHQLDNPQVVYLALLVASIFLIIYFFGNMLAPVLAGVVIAYLLDGIVKVLQRNHIPRMAAMLIVFCIFMLSLLVIFFAFIPLLSSQFTQLVQQIPVMLGRGQSALLELPQRYPDLFSIEQINEIASALRSDITGYGQNLLTYSVSSVVGIITFLVYVILVPILVFFFLKDKDVLINWFSSRLPQDRRLADRVWVDVNMQIANYIRGKILEILIVSFVTFITFSFLRLEYALLLAVMVGLSVVIPYVGAAVVTVPVLLIAWFQWGWGSEFVYVAVAYLIIQALDGNLLVPLLFSEVVNLHPIAIIVAVLIFGGLWGTLGVFFAIPLATLVQAIMSVWPQGGRRGYTA